MVSKELKNGDLSVKVRSFSFGKEILYTSGRRKKGGITDEEKVRQKRVVKAGSYQFRKKITPWCILFFQWRLQSG